MLLVAWWLVGTCRIYVICVDLAVGGRSAAAEGGVSFSWSCGRVLNTVYRDRNLCHAITVRTATYGSYGGAIAGKSHRQQQPTPNTAYTTGSRERESEKDSFNHITLH